MPSYFRCSGPTGPSNHPRCIPPATGMQWFAGMPGAAAVPQMQGMMMPGMMPMQAAPGMMMQAPMLQQVPMQMMPAQQAGGGKTTGGSILLVAISWTVECS